MSFLFNLILILVVFGTAVVVLTAYAAKAAARHPETAGGVVKFLVGMFKK